MTTDDEMAKQKKKTIDRAIAILGENFDAVVILASSHAPTSHEPKGETKIACRTMGNFYACMGMVDMFRKFEIANEIDSLRGGEDDDGEDD